MGSKINYSFIIPHHNSPQLLKRCIDSIPQREDIEIIVADDNSDADKQAKTDRSDVKILTIDKLQTKGAGHARNVAMGYAKGEWFLFPDCDDFYERGFLDDIEREINNTEAAIIFFDVHFNYDTEKQICLSEHKRYTKALRKCKAHPLSKYWQKYVKHSVQTPWNFIIKSSLVKNSGIRFEEVEKGNDFYFHHEIAMSANSIAVINKKLYYWVHSKNGITNKARSEENLLEYLRTRGDKSTLLRVKAEAWNTIEPLHIAILKNIKKRGFLFAFRYAKIKIHSKIPWKKIYYHQFIDFLKFNK